MGGEKRFPYETAYAVACQIVAALAASCERVQIAGSLRRCKPDVGDIEILYIPRTQEEDDPDDFFSKRTVNITDVIIKSLIIQGVLELRKSVTGKTAYGPKNKLMVHVPSGIPVDLFAATQETWWNQLVCRTGPAELNKEIAAAAIAKGWHWNVYGSGFTRIDADSVEMHGEAEVFAFVGMPCLDPERR